MARRNDHTREELMELALDNVSAFLEDQPHHNLSLRKVAGMIGYVPSTLINVFGSYDLLLLAMVGKTLDMLTSEAKEAMAATSSPRAAIHALAHCYLDFARQNPYRWQLIFQHSMSGQALPDWQNRRISLLTDVLETQVRALTNLDDAREVQTISRVLWAGVHGITLLAVDNKLFADDSLSGAALIDNLLDNYLARWN
uniref:TetR/AcrR family transcriptional regulator n=1 Tax=Thaumasiovibrio occultus TaxID=1891184 RepID=UPI000B35CE7C|nr:TetR-like C-terminal domain-containing protein [Thaumasiovibrio occultus]